MYTSQSTYGTNMGDNINNITFIPTQSGFNFTRNNNRGSYINNKVYFVRYSPEYKIIKIDFGVKGIKTFQNPGAFENGFLHKPDN